MDIWGMDVEVKQCPLCEGPVHCRVNDITHCDCHKIVLNEAAGRLLANSGLDCLCNNCLEKLNTITISDSFL